MQLAPGAGRLPPDDTYLPAPECDEIVVELSSGFTVEIREGMPRPLLADSD